MCATGCANVEACVADQNTFAEIRPSSGSFARLSAGLLVQPPSATSNEDPQCRLTAGDVRRTRLNVGCSRAEK
jgi:hypothetical protein